MCFSSLAKLEKWAEMGYTAREMKNFSAETSAKGRFPLREYRRLLKETPVCCVDVLFFSPPKTKTLLFKRANKPLRGVYFSMGGRLRKNEKLIDGAVRQARQETGLRIRKNSLIFGGVQEEIHRDSIFKGVSYHAVDVFYGYILKENERVRLDGQHEGKRWFSLTDPHLHPFIKSKIRAFKGKI